LTEAEALEVGEREHTRWCRLRMAGGWRRNPQRPAPGLSTPEKHAFVLRQERARLHPDLVPWEELDVSRRSANAEAVQTIVGRLYQWGVVPVKGAGLIP